MDRRRVPGVDAVFARRPQVAVVDEPGVALRFDVTLLLPAISGDRVLLSIDVDREGSMVQFTVRGAGTATASVRWAAAVRVVQAHAGSVVRSSDALRIALPLGAGR